MTWDLERIRMRCVCPDGEEGCWLWQGGLMKGKYPIASEGAHGRQKQFYVRRRVFQLAKGRAAPKTPARVLVVRCKELRCVSPHCLVVITKSEVLRASQALQITSRINALKAAKAKAARSKVPDEDLPRIRGSGMLIREIMAEWGVSRSHAAALRAGKARPDRSSPFAALLRPRDRAQA